MKPKPKGIIRFLDKPETQLLEDSFLDLFQEPEIDENVGDDDITCIYTHFTPIEYSRYKNLKYVVAPCTNIMHLNPDSQPSIDFLYLDTLNDRVLSRLYNEVHSSSEWILNALFNIIKFDKSVELRGKHVGFIGYGRMGQLVAKKLSGFDLDGISYYSIKDAELYINPEIRRVATMEEILRESDIIIMGCTYDTVTDNIIDSGQFRLMRGKYFLNNTRSRVVNGLSLVSAIENGWLKGVAIDVYEQYPSYVKTRLSVLGSDPDVNFYYTPHIAGKGKESRIATDDIVLQLLKGKLDES